MDMENMGTSLQNLSESIFKILAKKIEFFDSEIFQKEFSKCVVELENEF